MKYYTLEMHEQSKMGWSVDICEELALSEISAPNKWLPDSAKGMNVR